jgi:hypothetical protein
LTVFGFGFSPLNVTLVVGLSYNASKIIWTNWSLETEVVIKQSPNNQVPNVFTMEFWQIFIEKLIPIPLKLFPQTTWSGGNTSNLILWGQHHSDSKTTDMDKDDRKKENWRLVSLKSIETEIHKSSSAAR